MNGKKDVLTEGRYHIFNIFIGLKKQAKLI